VPTLFFFSRLGSPSPNATTMPKIVRTAVITTEAMKRGTISGILE